MIEDEEKKIGRPRQLYTGMGQRRFESVEKRAFESANGNGDGNPTLWGKLWGNKSS